MKISLEGFVQDSIHRKLNLYHVLVRQHGEIIGTFDWRENRRDNIHSVSKSFLSIAIGMAVGEGFYGWMKNRRRFLRTGFRRIRHRIFWR